MLPRKLLPFTTILLALLGLFLLAQTLPAHSQGNPAADLMLYKAVTPLTALEPGSEIQYTLTFSNAGVLTATDVLISDTLPTLLTGVAVTSNLPITATGQASWIVAPLSPGADGIITVTATVSLLLTTEQPFTNTATITSPITDTEPANNTSFVVSEVNLPPVVDAGPDASAIVGQPYALTATFTDPGLDDTHTAEIAWGDGLTGTAILSETAHTFTATHMYTATGTYTVTVGVRDNDGGQGSDTLFITVEPAVYYQYVPLLYNFVGNPMNYVEVSPLPNHMSLNPQTQVVATYGLHLLDETVTPQNFVIHSLQGGVVTGTIQVELGFNGDNLIWTPGRNFMAGEEVQATLTTELAGLMGINTLYPDYPKVWQFQIAPSGGSGYLLPASVPTFGGGTSTDLAWGDLDGDGDGDVLITNEDQPATVWLNDGQGAFTPHPMTPELGVGGEQAVALGDLDNDWDVDAVLATLGEETVWLNDGLGNFTPHPTAPTFGAGSSLDVVLGDLNGDGFLDALIANTNGEPETVWLNDGAGAFFPHSTMPAFGAEDSTSVALGDVDGDFDLDAVIANTNGAPETVWLNDSTGQFSPHETMPTFGAGTSQAVRLGDLDADGDVDAVVANALGEAETVWMNDGTGGFSPDFFPASFGAGDSTDLALGDLDGDLDLDGIVANANGEPETVWLNDGVGGYSSYSLNPVFGEGNSQGVVLGDLEGDGDLDVIVANIGVETVWDNKELKVQTTSPGGNGGIVSEATVILVTFNDPVNVETIDTSTFTVRGKFTGDYPGVFSFPAPNQVQFTPAIPFLPGESIIVTLSRMILTEYGLPLKPFTWEFRVAVSGGTGVFEMAPNGHFDTGNSVNTAFGDLDGDRDLDMVVARYNDDPGGSVWLNDGTGNVVPHPSTPELETGEAFSIVLGDLDRDGDLDAIFGGAPISTVWLNDGTGGFSPHPTFPDFGASSNMQGSQLADLDGDGDLDAVMCVYLLNQGQIWLNDGIGAFSLSSKILNDVQCSYLHPLTLGDIDQDGDVDLLTAVLSTKLWLNNGLGDFTLDPAQPDFALNNFAVYVEVGDLDRDQDLDVIVVFWTGFENGFLIWFNDGQGHFVQHPGTPVFDGWIPAFINLADIDGDHDLDLIFVGSVAGSRIWLNDGIGNFYPHPTATIGYSESATLGDLDGDGDLDLLLTDGGGQYIWLNQNQ